MFKLLYLRHQQRSCKIVILFSMTIRQKPGCCQLRVYRAYITCKYVRQGSILNFQCLQHFLARWQITLTPRKENEIRTGAASLRAY